MKIILVLFLICCTHSFGLCVECPDKFIDLGGRCYYFSKDTANRIDASRKCIEMHSFLLSIQTEREAMLVFNQAVKENVKKEPFGYWTSGTRVSARRDSQFVWSSTWEPLTYTAWCAGEPNNWMNDEDCIHLTNLQSHNTKACWNDRGCWESTTHSRHPMHYICETEAYLPPVECDNSMKYKNLEINQIEETEETGKVEKLISSGVILNTGATIWVALVFYTLLFYS